ncbi:unnamed protein product [Bursaphelenchus xylophilus]|uniref:NADPH--cytochrome P450 reductase n=1 Tax=Bursaphelenchus xylophilus TaxID=6326 RepID=A0A1I7ST53_BURXY|nr:unnamed protein product [Bursaphelenchus xylophilus]CAG9108725.1 unnamed protein product [Bursaphelenchus xylophilus]
MDWIYDYIDQTDLIVLSVLAVVGAYIYWNYYRTESPQSLNFQPAASKSLNVQQQKVDRSFLGRMKSENRQVLILFGSQTGTAEELAGRLAKDFARYGKKALVMDPEEIEPEELCKITQIENPLLIACMATYGEGDPTDNAQGLFEYLNNNDPDFSGLHFAVFGLGNKTYEHYNEAGKIMDKRFEELGAKRIFQLGLGDDDANLEEDFMRWREAFLPKVAEQFGWELSQTNGLDRQYRLEIVETPPAAIFTGEYGRIGAYEKQRAPFDQKNPFLSEIVEKRELHAGGSERSCLHVEFKVDSTRIRYEAGDHLGIFPTNDSSLVDKIGQILDVNLETIFKLINVDTDASKRHPFPCPTTYRTALTHYVDIVAPVKSHVLRAFAEFTSDPEEKERLIVLSTASEEGLKEYAQYVLKERRSVVDILLDFKTCKPPMEVVLEMMPRLQARYYSISSSPKINADIVSVTAVVLKYNIKGREIKGVCTNYLADRNVGDAVPIFVRKSTMRLPHRPAIPVVMIGPGTGFAPFRGFIQERSALKNQGKEIGEMLLFFGCRHPDHDHIYKDEVDDFVKEGIVNRAHVAYSRLKNEKVYVQHLIWAEREHIWSIIQRGGNIYVCGDARNMARDVHATLLRIFREVGQLNEEAAQKFFKDLERKRNFQADVWS